MKTCKMCGESKPRSDFSPHGKSIHPNCKICTAAHNKRLYAEDPEFRRKSMAAALRWANQNKERRKVYDATPEKRALARKYALAYYYKKVAENPSSMRAKALLQRYGLTLERYLEIEAAQNGLCAICGGPPYVGKDLCVDHDHATGAVRGLLCHHCNNGIGRLQDNPAIVIAAAAYLMYYADAASCGVGSGLGVGSGVGSGLGALPVTRSRRG